MDSVIFFLFSKTKKMLDLLFMAKYFQTLRIQISSNSNCQHLNDAISDIKINRTSHLHFSILLIWFRFRLLKMER